jgi:hypothetical protein
MSKCVVLFNTVDGVIVGAVTRGLLAELIDTYSVEIKGNDITFPGTGADPTEAELFEIDGDERQHKAHPSSWDGLVCTCSFILSSRIQGARICRAYRAIEPSVVPDADREALVNEAKTETGVDTIDCVCVDAPDGRAIGSEFWVDINDGNKLKRRDTFSYE